MKKQFKLIVIWPYESIKKEGIIKRGGTHFALCYDKIEVERVMGHLVFGGLDPDKIQIYPLGKKWEQRIIKSKKK